MVLVIECIIICILFSLGIFIPLYKNPVGQIMSYPKKIRERVARKVGWTTKKCGLSKCKG